MSKVVIFSGLMTRKTSEAAIRKLIEAARKGMAEVPLLSQMEREVSAEKWQLGQRSMDERLKLLPPESGRPKSCPLCGQNARVRTKNVARTFKSLNGIHTVFRNYHYCEVCKHGFYPQDHMLGLPPEGELSPDLEERVADFALTEPYDVAEERWSLHYGDMPVSANQFRQVSKRLGAAADECNDYLLQTAALEPKQTHSENLYVMNDGGMVPMREGKWSETKVAVLFRSEDHLDSRQLRRGCIQRARYVAVLGGQEEFGEALRAALRVENSFRAKRIVWVGDGAIGNWNLAGMLAPHATQILDWCHALEHGVACGKSVLGEEDVGLNQWRERIETLLMASPAQALAELRECLPQANSNQCEAIEKLISYYEANEHRMAYADFRAQGLLIASGPVESAHRHVIQRRMKLAGQHWGTKGGRQMARLRASWRTAGPTRFMSAIRWAHRESTRLPTLPKARKRYASNR